MFNWSENSLLSRYFKRSALPYWCILLLDLLIVLVSGLFVYILAHRGTIRWSEMQPLLRTMLVYLVLCVISFRVFKTYSGILRYSSFVDLLRVGVGNLIAMLLSLVANFVLWKIDGNVFAHLVISHTVGVYVIATVLMWGVRVLVKSLYDMVTADKTSQRVLIYGAMTGGVALAKTIRSQRPMRFQLCGFISHAKTYSHNLLMGQPVWSIDADIATIIRDKRIKAVLVSPLRTDDFRKEQWLQEVIINAGCKIFMATGVQEWDGKSETLQGMRLNEVSVEDLLPRDEIRVDMDAIAQELTGRRILITGAAGSIGAEIVRQVAKCKPSAMMLIDQAETQGHDIRLMMAREFPQINAVTVVTSICKQERMEHIFSDFRPEYVFHAAAYKHVPMMEDNPSEAVQNNVLGTKIIADLSVRHGVRKFVMVSTDKAVNPTNVMGCSKRICEIYVQSLDRSLKDGQMEGGTQFVTTRFGNVLGSNGSVVPLFKEQIRNGGPVTVTDPNIVRFFMLIPEACKLVLEAGTKGQGGEIFVFDMGNPVRIADLAQRMIKLSGAHDVHIEYTGLREGEKLYEEVLGEKETTKPSFHEKIRIAQVREYDYATICHEIDDLISISHRYDNMETVRKMKRIVPEFKSNNSVYDVLDKETES